MITGLEQMNPGVRPELELGFEGMRAKEIENILVEHAKAGRIQFEPGPYTKTKLLALANGFLAQGLIPSVKPVPVDPRKQAMDEMAEKIARLEALLANQSAPALPAGPAIVEKETPTESETENTVPFKRGPGRPSKN